MGENERRIEGHANSGKEYIYPGIIKDFDYGVKFKDLSKTISFTDIHHDASCRVKDLIKETKGFKGRVKKYDEDDRGDITGLFSWWSVNIADTKDKAEDNESAGSGREEEDIAEDNESAGSGRETAEVFEPGKSRYGQRRFIIGLNKMIRAYEKCCSSPAEIRILGTFVYSREVMHALVIAPQGDETFKTKQLLARFSNPEDLTEGESGLSLENNPILKYSGKDWYEWKNFSFIDWDNRAPPDKKRLWGHLAFAFFLSPLPEQLLLLDEDVVCNKANWQTLHRCSLWLGEENDTSDTEDDQSEPENERESTEDGRGEK